MDHRSKIKIHSYLTRLSSIFSIIKCQNDQRFLCWLFANKPREVVAYEF